MFRSVSALLASIAMIASASAADLAARPAPIAAPLAAPVFDWTGFHVGLQAGGAWNASHWSGFVGTPFDTHGSGGLIGGQIGYDRQFGNFVLGVEGDLAAVGVDGRGQCSNVPGTVCSTKQSWVGSARGRVGYALDRVLVYGTGGVAFTNYSFREIAPFPQSWNHGSRVGWTAGVGAEYAFDANWSVGAEWKYADFGTKRGSGGFGPTSVDFRETENTLVARINYRF